MWPEGWGRAVGPIFTGLRGLSRPGRNGHQHANPRRRSTTHPFHEELVKVWTSVRSVPVSPC